MHLSPSKPQEGKIYYIAKSFRNDRGISTKKNVRRLGTLEEIRQREGVSDPWAWAQEELRRENLNEMEGRRMVNVRYSPDKRIKSDQQRSFNIGYLVLNKIYYELGIDHICEGIERQGNFKFDLNEIMRQLTLCRILWPRSKKETVSMASALAMASPVKLWDVYRALIVLGDNIDYIQQRLFHYSKELLERNTSVIYYDCTNFFYESTAESELRRSGASKENRRTPIVQMGIMMDADGLPLAFNINPGNTNEQTTLRPLEKVLGDKMNIEEFIMCTDAGLSSMNNRLYNNTHTRKYITVQSVKTLPDNYGKGKKQSGPIKTWAMANEGWRLPSDPHTEYTLEEILHPDNHGIFYDKIFYKERWYKTWVKDTEAGGIETCLEQRLIVSFSLKYLEYQRQTRDRNIDKAIKAIDHGNAAESPKNFRSYIITEKCTDSGEIADNEAGYSIDYDKIHQEEQYDGFYAMCTNLEEYTDKTGRTHHTITDLLKINRARWEIEYLFRILKTHFRSRPVYLQRDKAIKAHFAICFIALFLYRVLENRIGDDFTTDQILGELRNINALHIPSEGFVPTFKRTTLTDKLFDISGFYLDTEIITLKKLKSIAKMTRG